MATKAIVTMPNALLIIYPYWHGDTWVFDDESVGLRQEPFVFGIPKIIDELVKDIPESRNGFRLIFSAQPFPGYQKELIWIRKEMQGNWYKTENPPMEGWLCPALYRYFEKAPGRIYLKAEPSMTKSRMRGTRWWQFWK